MDDRWRARFDRQVRFAPLGEAGQERLQAARVLLVGCGALGGSLAQNLARAGVGELVLADRDVVEASNLPRQVLFDAAHAERRAPKVEAAVETLARLGGPTRLVPHAVHVDASNLGPLAAGADLVLDGTDNLATRYLVNDWCVREDVPWIYGGVVGGSGLVLPVLPGRGPCLRCVFEELPPAGSLPTCDTAGVVLPAVAAVAALQSGLALRWLSGDAAARAALVPALVELDPWRGEFRRLPLERRADCPCCGARQFPFLDGADADQALALCGRDAVQLPAPHARPDLDQLEARVRGAGARDVERTRLVLRFAVEGHRLTVFPDGRALVEGTEEPDRARALYDRWIGS